MLNVLIFTNETKMEPWNLHIEQFFSEKFSVLIKVLRASPLFAPGDILGKSVLLGGGDDNPTFSYEKVKPPDHCS